MDFGFTRAEAIKLTEQSGHQIDYLVKQGIVKPTKIGNLRRPTVLFTWEQLIELKIASKLRDMGMPFDRISSAVKMITKLGNDEECCLISILETDYPSLKKYVGEKWAKTDEERYITFLVSKDELEETISELLKRVSFLNFPLPALKKLTSELKKAANNSQIDLDSRVA